MSFHLGQNSTEIWIWENVETNLSSLFPPFCEDQFRRQFAGYHHHDLLSLIIPTDLNLEIWVACFSKNYTQDWPVTSSFNPKNRRPKAPPFFWSGLTQRLKTWCEKQGVLMLWDVMSWKLIHDLHPGRLTWNIKITQLTRKIIWTKPFIMILFQLLIFRGVRIGFSGSTNFTL